MKKEPANESAEVATLILVNACVCSALNPSIIFHLVRNLHCSIFWSSRDTKKFLEESILKRTGRDSDAESLLRWNVKFVMPGITELHSTVTRSGHVIAWNSTDAISNTMEVCSSDETFRRRIHTSTNKGSLYHQDQRNSSVTCEENC